MSEGAHAGSSSWEFLTKGTTAEKGTWCKAKYEATAGFSEQSRLAGRQSDSSSRKYGGIAVSGVEAKQAKLVANSLFNW